jgi:hypothetical protein
MDVAQETINQVMRTLGSRGGKARAEALSAKRRKEIATEASRAASVARKKKAKQKKAS